MRGGGEGGGRKEEKGNQVMLGPVDVNKGREWWGQETGRDKEEHSSLKEGGGGGGGVGVEEAALKTNLQGLPDLQK